MDEFTPVGFYVLCKLEEVEQKTESGIIVRTKNELDREKTGHDVGRIIAFGPICYKGFAGCKGPEDWGLKVGDLVEWNRYDGKIPRHDEKKEYRLIADSDIRLKLGNPS